MQAGRAGGGGAAVELPEVHRRMAPGRPRQRRRYGAPWRRRGAVRVPQE